ncbi:MAG: hypothetical protein NDI58_07235 [Geothrix sp.]|nr:hypothetical protein [Geothrix sp.]
MFARRQRKPPKGGYQSPLQLLLKAAQEGAEAAGVVRMPAAAWLRAAELYLSLQRSCRPVPEDLTAAAVVEEMLRDAGLTAQWEGDDLVLGRPGWTTPPPRTVAVQPGLFESAIEVGILAHDCRMK